VTDPAGVYSEYKTRIPILSGPPRSFKISCRGLGIDEPAGSLSLAINRFTTLDNITFHLYDNCGNPALSGHVKNLSYSAFAHYGDVPGHEPFVTKGANANAITLPNNIIQKTDVPLSILCNVRGKFNKEVLNVDPVEWTLTYTATNVVDSIAMYRADTNQVADVASNSIQVSCGDSLPMIAFSILTENGTPYVPSLDNFSVEIRYESFDEIKENKSAEELFLPIEYDELTLRFNLKWLDAALQLQVGVYSILVYYTESRSQFTQTKLLSLRPVLGQCKLVHTAGEAHAVVPFDLRTREALNSLVASTSASTDTKTKQVLASDLKFGFAGACVR
jgi:hypothetical protein